MAAQGRGAIGGGGEGEARLGRERIGLGARVGRLAGREVVAGQRAGQLVVAERLVVARRGEVPRAPVAPRERAVGDLADERLDEPVLAALRRARIALDVEQLAPDEVAQARLELVGATPLDRGQRIGGEDLAEDGRVLEEAAIRRARARRAATR